MASRETHTLAGHHRWLRLPLVRQALECAGQAGMRPPEGSAAFLARYAASRGRPLPLGRPRAGNPAQARAEALRALDGRLSRSRHPSGFTARGRPTHLALAYFAWGGVPLGAELQAETWFSHGCPPLGSPRRNGEKEQLLAAQHLPVDSATARIARLLARQPAGARVQMLTRSESNAVPVLVQLRYARVETEVNDPDVAPWPIYEVRSTPRLRRAVERAQDAREAYSSRHQQVSLFAA